ncbi:MAG: hybrid sensor histidine kinase/response regulator [Sulfurimonadaceae bacterium]|nr:hybrid sensor histidine kinase/response regulator [Sulfurimonadaceae bacterium]
MSMEKPTLLIVDDIPEDIQVLMSILKNDYAILAATNGEKALDIAAASPSPDMILLDIQMPEMDGYEVCRRLKADPATRHIPVLFVSVLDETMDRVRAFEAGAVDYLSKPVEREEVLVRVRTHFEISRLQAELAEKNEKLKELDELKSMFIASMSHELRTPLNTIIGFTGVLEEGIAGALNDKQKDYLGRVKKAGTHLLSLVSDIIDISKIEAGRIEAVPSTFTLDRLVAEAIEEMELIAGSKQIIVRSEVPPGIELHTDRRRLYQCLINYLSNAVKYSEMGKAVKITATLSGDTVDLRVLDEGIGIAEENLHKLFEAFERLPTHLRVKPGGTGLGLYLTKQITEQLLEGRVTVESEEGVGSTFGLLIPRSITTSQGNGV